MLPRPDREPLATRPLGPLLRLSFLLALAIGVFLVDDAAVLVAIVLALLAVWIAAGQRAGSLLRRLWKLWPFALLVTAAYALVSHGDAVDRWLELAWLFGLRLNLGGAVLGLSLTLRIVGVVAASQIARLGDPRAIATGLRALGVPASISLSVDAVLFLMGDTRGGREPDRDESPGPRFRDELGRLRRGDVGPLAERLERQITRAESHLAEQMGDQHDRSAARDLAVVVGICLTMLGIRALKFLPGVPIPPGHKMLLLTPLYVAATILTRRRFSSSLAGLVMGIASFLAGEGRYGIFNIFKHLAPGIVCDLGLNRIRRRARLPGVVFWSLFGAAVALARFATMFAIVVFVEAPAFAFALLIPGIASNATFGALSGYVTWHLIRRLEPLRPLEAAGATTAEAR